MIARYISIALRSRNPGKLLSLKLSKIPCPN